MLEILDMCKTLCYIAIGAPAAGIIFQWAINKFKDGNVQQIMTSTFGNYKVAEKKEEEERVKYVLHVAPGKGLEDYMKKISMLEKTFKGKIHIEDIPYSDEIIIYCYKKPIDTPEEEAEIVNVDQEINNILGGKK